MGRRGVELVTALVLDTGALIALERGDRRVVLLVKRVLDRAQGTIAIPATVVAQVWRGGGRQARLATLLQSPGVVVPPLDQAIARAVGLLCARSGHADIVDVHVAFEGMLRRAKVVTSDPDDLRKVEPRLALIEL